MEKREIDRLIIEKVLQLPYRESEKFGLWVILEEGEDAVLFRPSTNIQDAWIVVEKLRERGICLDIFAEKDKYSVNIWHVTETEKETLYDPYDSTEAETAPMAICLSSLKTVEVSS
jgi:Phage ABA sandwich domain